MRLRGGVVSWLMALLLYAGLMILVVIVGAIYIQMATNASKRAAELEQMRRGE